MSHAAPLILSAVLLLAAIGLLLPDTQTDAGYVPSISNWRRTSAGWEQAAWLVGHTPPRQPGLHPGVIAGLELLMAATITIAALPTRQS